MTLEIGVVLLLAIIAVVLFASEKYPVDLVALMLMATLLLTGIVTAEEGISGFSNTATVTVGAMFILSAGLFKTGVVNFLGVQVIRVFRVNFWLAMATMMIVAGGLSAFINNTPVVAIFIPIMLSVAVNMNISASKLLMPLSFAAMFGGVCTLIGTSTNILVSTIAVRYGQPAFSMFEFAPLGLIFFGAGLVYMLLIGIRLIPDRRSDKELTEEFGMGEYLTEIIVQPEAKSVGQPVASCSLVQDVGVEILEVIRDGRRISLPPSVTIIQAGDVLRVRGNVEKIKKLQEREGIALKPSRKFQDKDIVSDEIDLLEAVIAPNSTLEGKTLKRARFRDTYGATALAIRHRGTLMHDDVGTTVLTAGDVLLIEARKEAIERLKEDDAFVFVSEVGLPKFRTRKVLPALAIVAGVVATAAMGVLPIVISAIIGCVLLVVTRCITLEEAYRAIDWKVIFLLAGALTLGVALEKTGTALFISHLLIQTVGQLGPLALVASFYLLTSVLTNAMSNNATAVLVAPIAIASAESLQVDARPFLMAIAFAASASFMTPVGYQTNTMIYGVGQYRFADFLRVGTPLNILFWIIATLMIPYFWPL
ncbi:MAG: SLC13 family permease [Bacteroidota bacterium]